MQYCKWALLLVGAAYAQSDISVSSDQSSNVATFTTIISTTRTAASSSLATTSTVLQPPASYTATPITTSFFGLGNTANLYGASVIAANQASTTYQASCSSGTYLCIDTPFTITLGSTSLYLSNLASSGQITLNELYTCQISGTTSAACVYSVSARSGGETIQTQISTTYGANRVPAATFVVTGGLEKLAAASTIPPSDTGTNAASKAVIMSTTAHNGLLSIMLGSAGAALAFAVLL